MHPVTDPYDVFLNLCVDLAKLVVLSIVLERGLAFVFEHEWYRRAFLRQVKDPKDPTHMLWESKIPGLRGTLALVAAVWICNHYAFDVLTPMFGRPGPDRFGVFLTGVIAAGGSAGAIAVFQGVFNFGRDGREAMLAVNKAAAQTAAELAKLEADKKKAEAEAARSEAEARQRQAEATKAEAEAKKLAAEAHVSRLGREKDGVPAAPVATTG